MTENEIFLLTKKFMEEKPAVALALKELNPGIALSLLLEGRENCYCTYTDGSPQFHKGQADKSDVLFVVNAEAVRRLSELPCESRSETGIEIVREVVAGNIQVKLKSHPMNILSGGYLNIIKAAGPDFLNYLSQHGLKNMFKIMSFIRSMRP